MSKLITACSIVIIAIINSSCEHINDSKAITQNEFIELVSSARKFILEKEQSLNEKDKKIIKETEPRFSVYYTGVKYGQFFLEWKLTEGRILNVVGNGYLNKKESLRRIAIETICGVKDNPKKQK